MLNNAIREHHTYLAIFTMFGESSARLDFIQVPLLDVRCIPHPSRHSRALNDQNMEYKFVELMTCNLTRSPEEIVQHHITYRYNALKVRQASQPASIVSVQLKLVRSNDLICARRDCKKQQRRSKIHSQRHSSHPDHLLPRRSMPIERPDKMYRSCCPISCLDIPFSSSFRPFP